MEYRYKAGKKVLTFGKIPHFPETKSVSVILPTHNEAEGIKKLINSIMHELKAKNYEIIIVDDNSKDKTPEIIDSYANDRVVALHRYSKRGIFSAILDGIKTARSNIIVMMDADFSHPPSMIPKMIDQIKDYDIVSCSRFAKGGGVEAPFIQRISTIALNIAFRIFLFDLKVTDFTGGFHAIKRSSIKGMKFVYPAQWGEFDMELFYRARKRNLKILEIPFVYKYREEGHSKSEHFLKYAYIYWKRAIQLRIFG